MPVDVVMPQLGESVVEGTITKWLVREGDAVRKDQPIVEVATDKADTEVPSPTSGIVTHILVAEGQTAPTNSPIARLEPTVATDVATSAGATNPPKPTDLTDSPGPNTTPAVAAETGSTRQSPAVRKAAREHGVDVSRLSGSGDGGRVTKQDVLRAAGHSAMRSMPASSTPPPSSPAPASRTSTPAAMSPKSPLPTAAAVPGAFRVPAYTQQAGDEIVPFSRRRRIIADHMVYSKHVAPHVMTMAEIDMHKTARLREARKAGLKGEGINLTYLAFIATATARGLRENPLLNARVLDDAYVKLRRVNLGIAVDTPDGLVVPVIRDADELTVRGMARAIDEAAQKARDGRLTADDLSGATFSISNPGLKGNFVGAAIISQPNVAILRIGELVKRPVVLEIDGADTIAIHPVMFACLSYDHRIVDGVAANNFLHGVTELLEAGQFEI